MADYTLYTHPMSRGQIARWALHEAGADYHAVVIDWADRPPALLAANAMNKVPTLIHHAAEGDRVITECGAIAAYLAQGTALAPTPEESAAYYRWLFFATGPLEQAIVAQAMGWEVPPKRQGMVGFGSFERAVGALEQHLAATEWVCGGRFTMADVLVGAQVDWGLTFGTLPARAALAAYAERCRARPAYRKGKAIDQALLDQHSAP